MKTILTTALLASALFAGACSRSDRAPETMVATTPGPNLRSDAERLQQATAKAAEERRRAAAAAAPAATPFATESSAPQS